MHLSTTIAIHPLLTIFFLSPSLFLSFLPPFLYRTPKDTRPDRLSRLAAHLIDQKSFYPLFPPAVGANVDYEHVEQSGAFAVTPDVLLLPSDLTPFAKEVRKVLCVNPGKLAKGNAGGTYARMAFYPPRREDIHIGEYNARKGGKLANLYNRCAVSVLRV